MQNKENLNIDAKEIDNETKTLDFQANDTLFKFVDLEESKKIVSLSGKPSNLYFDILKRFCKNYVALISFALIIIIFLIAIIVPSISPYSGVEPISNTQLQFIQNLPPSYAPVVTEVVNQSQLEIIKSNLQINEYTWLEVNSNEFLVTYNKYQLYNLISKGQTLNSLLGTNSLGIDIWTRTWLATRDSLVLSFLVATTDLILGVVIGAYLGFYAGTWIDNVLTRIVDVIRNIPTLIWFLMLITLLPTVNYFTLYLILISVGWVYIVNVTRLWIITVKDQEFILAAKSIGVGENKLIFKHALPTVIGKLATNYVRRIVVVILSLSSLTFLGFLTSNNDMGPNLGTLLQEARKDVQINMWSLLLPSLILLTFSLTSQFVANGLHDALDPKIRGRA